MLKSINGYCVKTIKEEGQKRVNKVINGKNYKNASKLRIYYKKSAKKPVKTKDNSEYIKQLQALYNSLGIVAKDKQRAMSCLLYRFKRCNPYYNMLVTIYLEDNSKKDFFNMCYIIAHENDTEDFKTMYKELQAQLELETAVTRKQKAKQVYKPLSLEVLKENGTEGQTSGGIDNLIKELDLNILYMYLQEHCTTAQLKNLQSYLLEGEKIDTRSKKRIVEKLKNNDLRLLLEE